MKIILHIGNYKTGTSALQNFLYKNRQKLMEYGIYYGNTWEVVHNHAGLALGILKEALEEYGLLSCCSDLEELEEDPYITASKIRFIAESRGARIIKFHMRDFSLIYYKFLLDWTVVLEGII